MPFVEGETLRSRLVREHQLPIPDAVRITSAVGAALDHAHRHGSVHRDIKPENILLSDGNALVADFGIALALRDAGGARLTETGLSLGTPQYMSPEQATAERTVDARSDIYSLGATLYEMLAGEPPFTAATTQGVIAKLLTQSPVSLRVLRETVPPGLDAAILRSLAKAPADRFTSGREFVEALAAAPHAPAPTVAIAARARARTLRRAALAALAAAVALGVWLGTRTVAASQRDRDAGRWTLEGRAQLTTTGLAHLPAIAPDGKQLAFVSTQCGSAGCSDVIDVQDVGGAVTRRILEGASIVYGLAWSPDRRQLLVQAGIGGRGGFWLVSALGGPPRYLADHNQKPSFAGNGDSLVIALAERADSSHWLGFSGLDDTPRDSLRLPDSVTKVWSVVAVPGTQFTAVEMRYRSKRWVAALIGREGKVYDEADDPDGKFRVSHDALWWGLGNGMIIRRSFDPHSGRFSASTDTLLLGKPGGDARGVGTFDVSADGAILVSDDGIYVHDVWAAEWSDLAQGKLPDKRRVLQTSSDVWAVLSPDGSTIALLQPEAGASGKARLSVRPFAGGVETPVLSGFTPAVTSRTVFGSAVWADSLTVAVATDREGPCAPRKGRRPDGGSHRRPGAARLPGRFL